MIRANCHDAINDVKRSYGTAIQTVRAVVQIVREQSAYLVRFGLALHEIQTVAAGLHDLYFVRMFACFESALRDYWRTAVRDTKPPTEALVSSIGARRTVPEDVLLEVQEIREFRNFLIHEERALQRQYTIDMACRSLNMYLARLPLRW